MKYELGGKIMTDFDPLIPKTYSYLTDDSDKNKKAKGTKKWHKTKPIKNRKIIKLLRSNSI